MNALKNWRKNQVSTNDPIRLGIVRKVHDWQIFYDAERAPIGRKSLKWKCTRCMFWVWAPDGNDPYPAFASNKFPCDLMLLEQVMHS